MSPIYNIGSSALLKYWNGRLSISLQATTAHSIFIKGTQLSYLRKNAENNSGDSNCDLEYEVMNSSRHPGTAREGGRR